MQHLFQMTKSNSTKRGQNNIHEVEMGLLKDSSGDGGDETNEQTNNMEFSLFPTMGIAPPPQEIMHFAPKLPSGI